MFNNARNIWVSKQRGHFIVVSIVLGIDLFLLFFLHFFRCSSTPTFWNTLFSSFLTLQIKSSTATAIYNKKSTTAENVGFYVILDVYVILWYLCVGMNYGMSDWSVIYLSVHLCPFLCEKKPTGILMTTLVTLFNFSF